MRLEIKNINAYKNKHSIFWIKFLFVILILHLSIINSFAQRFTATVQAKEIPLNFAFEISFTVENGNLQKFVPPRFDGFDVMGPSTSQNYSIINGRTSKSVSYTYTLQPKKQGEFVIGSATAIVDGNQMQTSPVTVKIIAPQKQQAQQQSNDPFDILRQMQRPSQQTSEDDIKKAVEKNVFVRVIPSKSTLYQGDQLSLSYKLYYRMQLNGIQATQMPSYNGFLSEEFKLPERNPQEEPDIEVFEGKKYYTAELKRVSLFPTKSGKINIEPIELQSQVLVEVPDPYFGGFFTSLQPYDYTFNSNTISLDVKPLPGKNKPAAFSGAVGKFSFTAEYDKTKCNVGDEIKLKITYTGTGNLKLITAPKLQFPEEFEAYEPKTKDDYENNGSVVTGSKSFEYILVPQDGGTFKLPKYEFAYFDVEKSDYVKFTLPETVIEVSGKAKLSENVANFFKREKENIPKGIFGIKKQYIRQTKFVGSSLFWALAASPVVILLIGFFFRKREYSESELLLMRRSKANKIALRRMATAKKLLQKNNEQGFYNEVIRALWHYLSDKLYIPQRELSKENIADKLQLKNVSADKIEELKLTLDTCEQSLFSQVKQEGAMQQTYSKAIELIIDFEDQLKSKI